jgi:Tol biopolymer transport system component
MTHITVTTTGAAPNGGSQNPTISDDGSAVAFDSFATNLVAGDTSARDVFLRKISGGTTSIVSVTTAGAQASGDSANPSMASTSRYVAFESTATNLVTGDTNNATDIFLRDAGA